ncbi:E3 ubiquitin-protein ligase SINAT3 [Vitis vinifera]|uniref:E3 ubiquitin-protein ligase SINAT3 n=2 Tax=Vitis vinifera TaxID=29760 RepID=A0A438IF54_VITVI|nr:E3 ubiquitin-protein ligase SINAT3 [Vitis vinifera]
MIMAKGLPPLRQNLPKNLAAPPTPRHMIERLTLGDVVYLHHQALEKMAKSLELHCYCPWYGCPCSAVGDIPLLVSHLTDYHKACHNGHTLCSSCKARALNKCLSCMQQLGNIRCLALEKMGMSLELHCKYEEFGCPEIIPYYTKCIHEDCVTSGHTAVHDLDGSALLLGYSIPCFSPDRLSQGRHDLFRKHNIKMNTLAPYIKRIINCYGKYFCVHTEAFFQASTPICVVFLSLTGNHAEACNYSCSLEIGGNGRKLTFEGIPRSIRESERSLESADSLIVLGSMVHSLGGETREPKLEITCRIRKSQIPMCACVDKTG